MYAPYLSLRPQDFGSPCQREAPDRESLLSKDGKFPGRLILGLLHCAAALVTCMGYTEIAAQVASPC